MNVYMGGYGVPLLLNYMYALLTRWLVGINFDGMSCQCVMLYYFFVDHGCIGVATHPQLHPMVDEWQLSSTYMDVDGASPHNFASLTLRLALSTNNP